MKILLVAEIWRIPCVADFNDWSSVFMAENIDRDTFVTDFVAFCAIICVQQSKIWFLVDSKSFIVKFRGPSRVSVAGVRPLNEANFVDKDIFWGR